MVKNECLKAIDKYLKNQDLYTYFKDSNILQICMNKRSLPFAFLVVQPSFSGVILSFAVNFHDAVLAADLTLNLMHHSPIALGESFYISNSGKFLYAIDAYNQYELENDTSLLKLNPITDALH